MEEETAEQFAACTRGASQDDFAWLLHRSAHLFRLAFNQEATERGVDGVRDYIVLSYLAHEPPRTQAALGQHLGLDKTTLMSLLDRFEKQGLIVRRLDKKDRRARFPEITEAGRVLQQQINHARQQVETRLLAALSHEERTALRQLLGKLLKAEAAHAVPQSGSCI